MGPDSLIDAGDTLVGGGYEVGQLEQNPVLGIEAEPAVLPVFEKCEEVAPDEQALEWP